MVARHAPAAVAGWQGYIKARLEFTRGGERHIGLERLAADLRLEMDEGRQQFGFAPTIRPPTRLGTGGTRNTGQVSSYPETARRSQEVVKKQLDRCRRGRSKSRRHRPGLDQTKHVHATSPYLFPDLFYARNRGKEWENVLKWFENRAVRFGRRQFPGCEGLQQGARAML